MLFARANIALITHFVSRNLSTKNRLLLSQSFSATMPRAKRKSEGENGSGEPDVAKDSKKSKPGNSIPPVEDIDFSSSATTKDGKKWNYKISSFNVNGIKSWISKNGHSYIKAEDADVVCLQETRCDEKNIPDEITPSLEDYHCYWSSAEKAGYAGTALLSKIEPINVSYGIGSEEHDNEGRVITAEFDKFYVVTAYVPNAGRGLPRLPYRSTEWDPDFRKYLKELDGKKPVILCGDLNVAHQEIDLANPKGNKKSAGFTIEEREGFSELLKLDFIDTYRYLYPEATGVYSFWTFMANARAKNVGWRLDYFVISDALKDNLCDSLMRTDVFGSDHCPVVCLLNI